MWPTKNGKRPRITCDEHWWIHCWLMTIREFNGSHLARVRNTTRCGAPFSFGISIRNDCHIWNLSPLPMISPCPENHFFPTNSCKKKAYHGWKKSSHTDLMQPYVSILVCLLGLYSLKQITLNAYRANMMQNHAHGIITHWPTFNGKQANPFSHARQPSSRTQQHICEHTSVFDISDWFRIHAKIHHEMPKKKNWCVPPMHIRD